LMLAGFSVEDHVILSGTVALAPLAGVSGVGADGAAAGRAALPSMRINSTAAGNDSRCNLIDITFRRFGRLAVLLRNVANSREPERARVTKRSSDYRHNECHDVDRRKGIAEADTDAY
jgi:hypothetical protein